MAKAIFNFVTNKKWERELFIKAPHILTCIIYYALGMLDKLLRVPQQYYKMEQVELVHEVYVEEKK